MSSTNETENLAAVHPLIERPETPATNVIEALRRVMRDLPAIGKGERASEAQGGYAYRGIEQITREVQPLLAKHGVLFVPFVTKCKVTPVKVGNRDWTDTRLEVTYNCYGPGGPDDRIQIGPLVGIGRDGTDKGSNKALTQTYKYALLQTLCIADAKDDADQGSPESDPAHGLALGPDEVPTAAGNVRRGPRVLEGWADIEDQREAHDRLGETAARLNEDERAAMTQWRQAQGFGYPMTRPQLLASLEEILRLIDAREGVDEETPSEPVSGPLPESEAGNPPEGITGPENDTPGPIHEDDAARRARITAEVDGMLLPKVRDELADAGIDASGIGATIKPRLVELRLRKIDEALAEARAAQAPSESED